MSSLARGAFITSILTLVSRILGFARDLVVASLLGATFFADCYYVALRVPNLLRSFIAEGALTSAFVPLFADRLKISKERAQQTFANCLSFLLVLTLCLTALGIIFAPLIIEIIAPGFSQNQKIKNLAVLLLRVMMPFVIFIGLTALIAGALNTLKIFGRAAAAQVYMNLVLIFGGLVAMFFSKETGVILLAFSVLIGGIAQVSSLVPTLRGENFKLVFNLKFWNEDTKELLKLFTPALLGATIYQLNQFILTLLASLLETGTVSWIYYADRVTQLPIGIFSIALATALLPTLSADRANNNRDDFERNLFNSLRYTSFVIIPLSAVLMFFALPITQALFERGSFSTLDSQRTAEMIIIISFGLWAASIHSINARALMAEKKNMKLTQIGALSLLVSALFALLTIGPIFNNQQLLIVQFINFTSSFLNLELGYFGLGISMVVGAFASATASSFYLYRKHPSRLWRSFLSSTLQALVSAILAVALSFFMVSEIENIYAKVTIGCALAIPAYLAIAKYLFASKEVSDISEIIKKRFSQS
ncbi:MAG TPA: murein biosynthesis integral membrane protein MurJ [Oligoflexia bacterium]|nr:murein biosynthesis integral membrane protein MurJ [Oligoflexia bacterium]HMP27872.1 murein biosynthesis integral membrane protein MurJ [Oligoflexia bacterium]